MIHEVVMPVKLAVLFLFCSTYCVEVCYCIYVIDLRSSYYIWCIRLLVLLHSVLNCILTANIITQLSEFLVFGSRIVKGFESNEHLIRNIVFNLMMTNKTTLPKVVLISESPSAIKSHFKFNPLIFYKFDAKRGIYGI